MSRNKRNENPSHVALVGALLPVARVLMNDGVTATEVQSAAAQAFVRAAMEIAKLKNGKVNQSKVAIMTGYSRTEIRKVLSGLRDSIEKTKTFGAKRLLDGWSRDPEFSSRTGAKKALPIQGGYGSFYSLAKKYSGDIPPKAALDELIRTGLVDVRRGRVAASLRAGDEQSRRTAAIEREIARITAAFYGSDEPASLGEVTNSDLLEFDFELDGVLAIAEDRARQGGRAFMNGLANSLQTLAVPRKAPKRSTKGKLRVELTITRNSSSE